MITGDFCYNFNISGNCSRGLACRFGSQHIVDGFNVIDKEKYKSYTESDPKTLNNLSQELIIMLRKKKYDFKISENLVKYNDGLKKILVIFNNFFIFKIFNFFFFIE